MESLFTHFLKEFQIRLPDVEFLNGSSPDPVLTIPAKNLETGSIQVWDDGDELTIGIGKHFHCHYDLNGFTFDEISQEEAEKKCIDSAIDFIVEFLADEAILYVRFTNNKPSESGVVSYKNLNSIHSNAKKYVWSGILD